MNLHAPKKRRRREQKEKNRQKMKLYDVCVCSNRARGDLLQQKLQIIEKCLNLSNDTVALKLFSCLCVVLLQYADQPAPVHIHHCRRVAQQYVARM